MKTYDPIPKTVTGALKRWDNGESVFSVEMGGLGPGYEMAIQGLAFAFMRNLKRFKKWDDKKAREAQDKELDAIVHKFNNEPWGNFSGAQVGAAKSLASAVCKRGFRNALRMKEVKDRLIQVCKKDLRTVR